jgi:cytidine deaminase
MASAPDPQAAPGAGDDALAALVEAARAVRARAYAPYSGYAVGAAVRDESGRVHVGANVENAAYPEGICAEAAAIAQLVAAGGRRVTAVAVVCAGDPPATPCGGCRQKIREFARPDTPVVVADLSRERARYTLSQLLPHAFGPDHLGRTEDASRDHIR